MALTDDSLLTEERNCVRVSQNPDPEPQVELKDVTVIIAGLSPLASIGPSKKRKEKKNCV